MRAARVRFSSGIALLLLLAAGCSSGTDRTGGRKPEEVLVLHVLNTLGEEEIAPFADQLTQLSGGSIKLDVANKWELWNPGADVDAIHALQTKQFDLAVVPARAWHTVGVTSFDALIAPFAIDSMALQAKVLTSGIAEDMLSAVETVGLKGIGVLPGPMRLPVGITKSFTVPGDFVGASIGYFPSAVAEKTMETLGAVPVRWASEGTSISGFDGVETQVTAVSQYIHVARSITANVALWPRPNVLVANRDAYGKLSTEQRGWLHAAIKAAIAPTTALQLHIGEELGTLCRNAHFGFVHATAADLRALRTAVRPVIAWLRQNADTADYLDRIAALRSSVTPYPKAEPSCGGVSAPQASLGTATPFDGTYRMVTPPDCDTAQHSPENCGKWTFYFDRGQFAITQENGAACTWGYGSYEVTGGQVEWLFTDGGGIAPTNALNRPGEDFFFKWSVYKGRTILSAVPGKISPDNFYLRPWQRLSSEPNASYLSARCPPPQQALPK